MKKYFLAIVVLFSPLSSFADNNVSWVQDMIGGHRIQLENINGNTRITDVDSRESIVIKGEFAGKITNNQYTMMMEGKRKKQIEQKNLIVSPKALASYAGNSGSYQVSGGAGGFKTSKISCSNTSKIYLSISSKTAYTVPNDWLHVTLYRYIPFWIVDESYGMHGYSISAKEAKYSDSWSNNIKAGYKYYMIISKKYTGGYATGSYNFYQK